jgi:hypothetical protein
MQKRYTVHKKDLQKGAKIEAKEHPWASPARARRIARDHLAEKGPGAYRAEKMSDRIVHNINEKMGAKPIKRKPRPQNGIFYTDYSRYAV